MSELKNTFSNGLVLDFSPSVTPNTVLTNALNATLVTYNGNELSLQNDMGNGRVETAFLPEGYVPVGSCEFGGIIYIVSYNPLDNKSLIGCFPSPERNFAKDELDNLHLTLSGEELVTYEASSNTGDIKQYSIKKLLSQVEVNPGDKFLVSSPNLDGLDSNGIVELSDWVYQISDFNNTRYDEGIRWPKLVKITLITIDESGKITKLDSDLLWYTRAANNKTSTYWINSKALSGTNPDDTDIDSYRDLMQENFSVFQSKVSGRLALLVELEKIDSFNSAIKVVKAGDEIVENSNTYLKFDIYTLTSWTAESDEINPSGFITSNINSTNVEIALDENDEVESPYGSVFPSTFDENTSNREFSLLHQLGSKSESTLDDFITNCYATKSIDYKNLTISDIKWNISGSYRSRKLIAYNPTTKYTTYYHGSNIIYAEKAIPDDVINNMYSRQVIKYVGTVIVKKEGDRYNGTFNFTITPYMRYGKLDNLAINHTIDFSQYGSNAINLSAWKYKKQDSMIKLDWGFNALLDEDTKIESVSFEFRDYLGLQSRIVINNQESYNGVFTLYISLDSKLYLLTDSTGNNITHVIQCPPNNTANLYYKIDEDNVFRYSSSPSTGYLPGLLDSGIIYSNSLYNVNIIITVNTNGSRTNTQFTRWFWTNGMFDEKYTSINNSQYNDFHNLDLELTMDIGGQFNGVNLHDTYLKETTPIDATEEITPANNWKTLGSNTHYIGYKLGTDGRVIWQNNAPKKDDSSYINLTITPSLRNGHGCLINEEMLLDSVIADLDDTIQNRVHVKVALADSHIQAPDSYNFIFSDSTLQDVEAMKPIIGACSENDESSSEFTINNITSYLNYKDNFYTKLVTEDDTQSFVYYDTEGNVKQIIAKYQDAPMRASNINISLYGHKYNKIQAFNTILTEVPKLLSCLYFSSVWDHYNLALNTIGQEDTGFTPESNFYLVYGYGKYFGNDGKFYYSRCVYKYEPNGNSMIPLHEERQDDTIREDWKGGDDSGLSSILTDSQIPQVLFIPILFSQVAAWSGSDGNPNGWYPFAVLNVSNPLVIPTPSTGGIPRIDYGADTYTNYNQNYDNNYSATLQSIIGLAGIGPSGSQYYYRTHHNYFYMPLIIKDSISTTSDYQNKGYGFYCVWEKENNAKVWKTVDWVPSTLGVTYNNKGYSLSNFFRFGLSRPNEVPDSMTGNLGGAAYQPTNFKPFSEGSSPYNYAQLIASLLGQIYYKVGQEAIHKYRNLITLEQFDETWKQLILIKPDFSFDYQDPDVRPTSEVINSLLRKTVLLPNRMSLLTYLEVYEANNPNNQANADKITPIFNDDVVTLEMNYTDTYNVDNIYADYSLENVATVDDFTDNNHTKTIETTVQVVDNGLYNITEGFVLDLKTATLFRLLNTFKVVGSTRSGIPDDTDNLKVTTSLLNYFHRAGDLVMIDMGELLNDFPSSLYKMTWWSYKDSYDYADSMAITGFTNINLFPYTNIR